ncbi:hypothetical protein FS749_010651, partial [Ceratobasidium sp. UAMH 11750]
MNTLLSWLKDSVVYPLVLLSTGIYIPCRLTGSRWRRQHGLLSSLSPLINSLLQQVEIPLRMVFLMSSEVSQVPPGDLVAAMPPLGSSLVANSVAVDRVAPNPIGHLGPIEEKSLPLDDTVKEADASIDEKNPHAYADEYSEDVKLVNGQPVIETGVHVSNFAIEVRDDGDASLTWRSFWIGTIVAGLGAALSQIYIFKPID